MFFKGSHVILCFEEPHISNILLCGLRREAKSFFFSLTEMMLFLNDNIIRVLIIDKSKIQIEFFSHFDSPKLYMS